MLNAPPNQIRHLTAASVASRDAPLPAPQPHVSFLFGPRTAMQLVLFDIDGTLTRTEDVDTRCYLCALGEALGTTDIDTDWAKYRDVTDSGIASALWEARHGALPSSRQLDS